MSRYDGLIIPRSYSEYINKTDAATLSQALQLGGVLDSAPTEDSVKAVKSGGVFNALAGKQPTLTFDNTPTDGSTNPVKSGGIFAANAVIMANNKTLSGMAISTGSVVRVLFTANLTGSDATTGLTLTYNGTDYAVKVGKDGALVALTAHLIEESYIYLQAYTTLELTFDGSQFVVMGNPVVISNADFSIMADGSITYTSNISQKTISKNVTINASYNGGKIDVSDINSGLIIINYIGNADYNGYGVFFFSKNYGNPICENIANNNTSASYNNNEITFVCNSGIYESTCKILLI